MIRIAKHMLSSFILCLFLGVFAHADTTPKVITVQAKASHRSAGLYNGAITTEFGLYPGDLDTPIWEETVADVPYIEGNFSVQLGTDENNPITTALLNNDGLRLGIKIGNGVVNYIPIKSVPYSIQSNISEYARQIKDTTIMFFDRTNSRVGIGTTTPTTKLDVAGTINATGFIGDGSGLTNINVDDGLLLWTENGDDLYYVSGNVGIGLTNPEYLLHVSGDALIEGDVTVNGTINATAYVGDGSLITQLNAGNINQGVLPSARLIGDYPAITGVGTITSGTWEGDPLTDTFVADNITLSGGTISGTNNISGFLQTVAPLTIGDGEDDITIDSQHWSVSPTGAATVTRIETDQLEIFENTIRAKSALGVQIKPETGNGILVDNSGRVGINNSSPQASLDIGGGIRVGDSAVLAEGTIRFDGSTFYGRKGGAWVDLAYLGTFDGHSLDAADGTPTDAVYVSAQGYVGIGVVPSPEESLEVSGNAVFKGTSFGQTLSVSGAGTRMLWYPRKAAFRAGSVSGTQWDDGNIGFGSVAMGISTIASDSFSSVLGGQFNTASAAYSNVSGGSHNTASGIGSAILGGRYHRADGVYSVVAGGGTGVDSEGNSTSGDYAVVAGGYENHAAGEGAMVIGGTNNQANGDYSLAAGNSARALHDGSFVWADNSGGTFSSTAANQFLIRASNGVGINNDSPAYALDITGTLNATHIIGNGRFLSEVSAHYLDHYAAAEAFSATHNLYISRDDGYMPTGTIDTVSILNFTILEEDIADGTITGDKIASGSIIAGHITADAITGTHIADATVTSADLAEGAITSDKIASGSITGVHIAGGAITSFHIATGSISGDRIASGSITVDLVASGSVSGAQIIDGSISSSAISEGSLTGDQLATGSISWEHIIPGETIPSYLIATGSITGEKIASGAINSGHIATGSVQNHHIADGAITNDKLEGTVPVWMGGTNQTSYTAGSVIFAGMATGTMNLLEDNDHFYYDSDDHYLGLGTNAPEHSLHVSGNAYFRSGSIVFRDGGTSDRDYIRYENSAWLSSPGYLVVGGSASLASTSGTGGLRAKDMAVSNKMGIGTLTPLNALDIDGAVAIGSNYAGVETAPSNGLIVEGFVGIGTTNPTVELDVSGSIRAESLVVNSPATAIRGIGGTIGIYGEGTVTGIFGEGGDIGVHGINRDDGIGVRGEVLSSAAGAKGVYGELMGSYRVQGALGWTDGTNVTGVYGKSVLGSSGTHRLAGLFDGRVYVGDPAAFPVGVSSANIQIKTETNDATSYAIHAVNSGDETIIAARSDKRVGIGTDSPDATLDVDGTTLFEKTAGYNQHSTNTNTIDWRESNKVRLTVTGPLTLSFTAPPHPTNLMLIIDHQSTSAVTFPASPTVKWPGGIVPTLTNTVGAIDIVSLYYDGSTYYAFASKNFD